jgi:transposase
VINVGTLSKLRRLVRRDGLSVREASRRLGISRNTATRWLAMGEMVEPKYRRHVAVKSIVEPYKEILITWLKADGLRNKRERRTTKALADAIGALGYRGSRGPVYEFCKHWRDNEYNRPRHAGFVPMSFALGEAFQFDWSCEYAFVQGLRKRLEVAHIKLAASRAFVMVAYYAQSHEMLFDAHAQAFEVFGGVPKRGIYDNMRTAVDKVGVGKQRSVNARFESMAGHYLFEAEFCNRAAGWEKGIVEKNVQDRRRGLWREITERRWATLGELNEALRQACVRTWQELKHPEWSELSVAEVWQDEQLRLMPCPRPFDGYIETLALVSPTSLVSYQRNRYSVPCAWINSRVSLRAYPATLHIVGPHDQEIRVIRSFERDQTIYDWTHYIELIERKPGALRNGAPFKTMPEALLDLQRQLLTHPGGDRVMAKVLSAVPVHGLEPVVQAAERALMSGRVSGEHVLNLVSRIQEPIARPLELPTVIEMNEPSQANVDRYDALITPRSDDHVQ